MYQINPSARILIAYLSRLRSNHYQPFWIILLVGIFLQQQPPVEAVEILTKQILKNDIEGVEININYPYIDSDNPSASIFNQIARDIAIKIWEPYYQSTLPEESKKPLWELKREDFCEAVSEDCDKVYSLEYKVHYLDENLISIEFFQYWSHGGLHGFFVTFGLSYDFRKKREIKLENLFRHNTPFLVKLADLCNQNLSKRECVIREVTPQDDEFTNWVFDKEGLNIIFPIYSVASYSCGEQEVKIPYKSLSDILDVPFTHLLNMQL
ncbi:DUF3298 and DUF4163 domain-containing protein [Desulfogranum marinum]|uniref:DUF3298 and DUF4163 domain-containing protein n=1 Tax=Desulfogranum marinum TaxID=453220 RepID=UPI00196314A2|nr:DUF3298 and DUF4163 domain-containing protein [Desulfogranum marinum]MBM9514729.1 DUF3298 domain-containing protein [Desulfogranum marinum]